MMVMVKKGTCATGWKVSLENGDCEKDHGDGDDDDDGDDGDGDDGDGEEGTCTTGWKVSLEKGSSFGRRQRCGIEAPTNTQLIMNIIMIVLLMMTLIILTMVMMTKRRKQLSHFHEDLCIKGQLY